MAKSRSAAKAVVTEGTPTLQPNDASILMHIARYPDLSGTGRAKLVAILSKEGRSVANALLRSGTNVAAREAATASDLQKWALSRAGSVPKSGTPGWRRVKPKSEPSPKSTVSGTQIAPRSAKGSSGRSKPRPRAEESPLKLKELQPQ